MSIRDQEDLIAKIQNQPIIKTGQDVELKDGEYFSPLLEGTKTNCQTEITHLKGRHSIDEIKNEMLGYYDATTGKYCIPPKIKDGLRMVIKKTTGKTSGSLFATSVSKFGTFGPLNFVVNTVVSLGKATSYLYLCENIARSGGTVDDTQVHLISTYEKEDKTFKSLDNIDWQNYIKGVYVYFNIIHSAIDNTEPQVDVNYVKALLMQQMLLKRAIKTNFMNELEEKEADLLLLRTELLSKMGGYGFKVLQDFETLKEQIQKQIRRPLSASERNEILEEVLKDINITRQYSPALSTELDAKTAHLVASLHNTATRIFEQQHAPYMNEINKRMKDIIGKVNIQDLKNMKAEKVEKARDDLKIEAAQMATDVRVEIVNKIKEQIKAENLKGKELIEKIREKQAQGKAKEKERDKEQQDKEQQDKEQKKEQEELIKQAELEIEKEEQEKKEQQEKEQKFMTEQEKEQQKKDPKYKDRTLGR